jgi:hypothetical protein
MKVLGARQPLIDHLDGYIDYLDSLNATTIDREKLAAAAAPSVVVPTIMSFSHANGVYRLGELQRYPELQIMPQRVKDEWAVKYQK